MKIFAGIKDLTKRQPLKTMGIICVIWVLLAAINLALYRLLPNSYLNTPIWFPISLSSDPALNVSGIPYAILFLVVLYWVARERKTRFNLFQVWMIGLVFIILGNLIQGNVDIAFRQPLYASNNQYYHDALKISSWVEWLRTFNAHQTELLVHSKTHPPFAVLIHYLFIQIVGNRPLQVAGIFVFISSLSIAIMGLIFNELGVERENRNRLAILFALIPAINVYTAVSLDGVILTTSAIWLLGLVILVRRPKFATSGMLLFVSGILLTNLLTFVGIYLFAVSVFVGMIEYLTRRKASILIFTGIALGLLGILIYALNQFGHYNHVQAFFTASHIENPQGFRGLITPVDFVMSRVECVGELALFFSIGCLATVFHRDRLKLDLQWVGDDIVRIALVAVAILVGLFVMGLNQTGETARSCLFIYPFLLLLFYKSDLYILNDLIVLAGLQTAIMQLFFHYFW